MVYGALGNDGALAMILAMLFFSIHPGTGEINDIVCAAAVSVVDPTMTVFSPTIVSFTISDTLTVNVHAFLIVNPLENNFTPWSCGVNV